MAAKELVIDVKMENSALKAEINRLNGQLDQLRTQAKNTGTGLSGLDDITKLFNKSTGGAIGLITKFGGVLGAATTAGEVFGRMMSTNQTLGDAVERVQTQVNSAMDYFAQSLASMDFNNFISGLRNAITEGGKLADMLDELETHMQQLGVRNAKTSKDIAEQYKKYYSTKDLKERQRIMEDIEQMEAKRRQETINVAKEQRAAGYETLKAAVPGASEEDMRAVIEGTSGEVQLKAMADKYKKMLNSKVTYQSYSPSAMGIAAPVSHYTPEAAKYMNSAEGRQGQIAFQLLNAQDSKGGSLKEARDMVRQSYEMEANAVNQEVTALRKKSKTDAAVDAANQKLLKTGGGGGGVKTEKAPMGSLQGYDDAIAAANKRLKFATDPRAMIEIQKEIRKLTDEKWALQFTFNKMMWESEHGKMQAVIERKPLIQPVKIDLKVENEKMKKAMEDIVEKVNKQLLEYGINRLAKGAVKANKFADAVSNSADAFGYLAEAMKSGGADETAQQLTNIVGVMNTMAQMIPIVQALTMSKEQLAAADAKGAISASAKSAAQTPIIGWLLVAAAVAACVAALASMDKYAGGGIVGGSSLVGDQVLARLNGGEMVLNSGQQSRLFQLLDGTASIGGGMGEVTWRIKGSDLYGTMRNYNDIKRRVRR